MRAEWGKAEVMRAEAVDYAEDGSAIFEEFPHTIDVVSYYGIDGVLIGRTFDDPLWCAISDETEKKLSSIIEQAGFILTDENKWILCNAIHDVFYFAEAQFWTSSAVRNQEALKQLINAYEALDSLEQDALTEAFLEKANCGLPMARNGEGSTFLRAAKGLLDKGEGGNPPTFQGALNNLQQEMIKLLSYIGLEPEDKDKGYFEMWMKVLLKDSDITRIEEKWKAAEENNISRLAEKMPDTMRGILVVEGASKSGEARSKPYQALYENARAIISEIHNRNAYISFTECRRLAAERAGISEAAARKHIKKSDFKNW